MSNIKPLHIETVFSGFIHLVWITLVTLYLLGKSPIIVMNFLETMGSGTAVFLVAVVFSLSFFLGKLAEHFLIAFNYFINKEKRQKYVETFMGSDAEIWANKIFSLSSCGGLLLVVIISFLITGYWEILYVGAIPISATLISFLYWYKFGKKKRSNKH